MMRTYNKSVLAMALVAAIGMAGCSDGEDGKDGEPGAPGEPGGSPVVETSEVTNVEFISHLVEEGKVTLEFEITNEEGNLINGLTDAAVYLALKTDSGIQRSRDGEVGGSVTVGGDEPTEGATLTMLDDGHYQLVAPIASVQADSEVLTRLQVGDGETIADSPYIIVNKPEMTHTTTTETCYSCHVDYATSDIRHSRYVALNTDGEVDFVGGCMVCHNNVPRDIAEDGSSLDTGGYAKNTMQKLGHVNHQKFEKDFTPTNCYTCHAEPVINTSIAGNGCSDCHGSGASGVIVPSDGFDARAFHAETSGLDTLQEMRVSYRAETTEPFKNDLGEWCTTMSLYEIAGETETMVHIGNSYNGDGGAHIPEQPIVYAGAYLHGYYDESIVGRFGGHTDGEYKTDNADGSRTHCYPVTNAGFESSAIMASARIGLSYDGWIDNDSEYSISFTAYSDAVDYDTLEPAMAYERRLSVTNDSCTTCHTSETNYHKNGAYNNGGMDCVACHNNGQDRRGAYSAPGYGPMVHSMHWGRGNMLGDKAPEANSAASLNGDNCVSCHADGVSLADIPNQYILSKAFNEGVAGVMTSPVTANCIACHDSAAAQNHMEQNGGEYNVPAVTGEWYKQDTMESCATCHDTGKSFGIDMFHNFER